MTLPTDAQSLARACAESMYSRDNAAQALGMRIEQVAPGRALLAMTVRKDMVNGHAICHGGMIFTLADTAFAYACNTYNRVAVAAGVNIEFLAPGREGDTLRAEAVEQYRRGRNGVYDIAVRDGAGQVVALFRGKSRDIEGTVIPA